MQPATPAFERIVVGFDGSERGHDAVRLGETLASTTGAGLEVVRVHRGISEEEREQERHRLAAELEAPAGAQAETARFRVLIGDSPARALHELAEAEGPDLIVLGSTHRAGIGRVVPGSVVARLLSGVSCPVAIAPSGYGIDGLRVIEVGFDGSPESEDALHFAAALAERAEATLRVVAVGRSGPVSSHGFEAKGEGAPAGPAPDLQSRLHAAAAELSPELRALPIFAKGDPVGELIARAEEGVDLLVLGSRGYGPVRAVLLGSVSAVVLERAPCPVVITPRSAVGDP
jgi:nucleotide-binding universal stress UspA family protein